MDDELPNKPITLVTGATGLVGNNTVRLLLEAGEAVRVLARENSDPRPLQGLDLEVVRGDVRDRESVQAACNDVGVVIHSAAVVQIGWTGLELQRAVNVEGSRNVAQAARQAGARMVHVSSVDALGIGSWDLPASEESPREGKTPCSYVITKREAEEAVHQEVRQGLHAVLVNPGFMLGPWDWKPSSGRMLLEVAKRFTPLAPRGGFCLCDVRDVAAGILSAANRGTAGRNYILGGHNLSYLEGWRRFAEITQSRPPRGRLGPLLERIAGAGGDLWGRLSGREPEVNSAAIAISSQVHFYSSQRAIEELGYQIRPAQETIRDAWDWFCSHGYVD